MSISEKSALVASSLLERARIILGSDQKVADSSELSRTAVSELRRGVRGMSLHQFFSICEGSGIDPSAAITGKPQGKPAQGAKGTYRFYVEGKRGEQGTVSVIARTIEEATSKLSDFWGEQPRTIALESINELYEIEEN